MLKKFLNNYGSEITEIPELLRSQHLPSLDGFRGISILMVVIGHLGARIDQGILAFIFNGNLGVYIFFVISGFLITTLLLKEKVKTGTISLRNFYIRRFFRIFPVAYLYLLVLLGLNQILVLEIPATAFLFAAFYIQNVDYSPGKNWYTEHYWSLSLEEQFYLVCPSILKKNFRFYCYFILTLLIALPIGIIVCRQSEFLLHSRFYSVIHFMLQFDGVLVGSLFSILFFKNLIPWKFIRKYKIPLNIVLMLITMAIHNNQHFEGIRHLSSFMIATVIISNLYPSKDLIFRLLNNRILTRIGILSYSIYIWQQLFTMTSSLPSYQKIPWYSFPINLVALGLVSYLSYNFFEKYFLRLKERFKR